MPAAWICMMLAQTVAPTQVATAPAPVDVVAPRVGAFFRYALNKNVIPIAARKCRACGSTVAG